MAGVSQKGDDESLSDINVTPLVDVCLVLVIIFMAIAPFALQSGIKVLETKAKAAVGKATAAENVTIQLRKDGTVTVNQKAVAPADLLREISAALSRSKDRMTVLKADEDNLVGQVVEILDTAKQAGAKKIAIMSTARAPEGPEAG